jgi:hypothetical protein
VPHIGPTASDRQRNLLSLDPPIGLAWAADVGSA